MFNTFNKCDKIYEIVQIAALYLSIGKLNCIKNTTRSREGSVSSKRVNYPCVVWGSKASVGRARAYKNIATILMRLPSKILKELINLTFLLKRLLT